MDYALKRQLSFGIVFIFIIFTVALSLYQTFAPKPTCFDGRQNQQEEKTDCGGPYCQACKVTKLENIAVLSSHMFLVGGTYDAVAKIQNKNQQLGSHSFSYVFTFYDADKAIIGEKKGTGYVLAGQTRYIVENNIIIDKPVSFMEFTVSPVTWEEQKISLGPAALPIFSKKYEQSASDKNGFSHVVGTVQNQSPYSFSVIDIAVVLLDKNQQPIAVGQTQISGLRFDEKRDFTVLFAQETPTPSAINAEASANVFDLSNVR